MLFEEIEDRHHIKEEVHDLPNILELNESEASLNTVLHKLSPVKDERTVSLQEDDDNKLLTLKSPTPSKMFGRRVRISKFDNEIIEKLWRTDELGLNNPRAILLTIWYFLTKKMGIRSRNEHCKLKLKNFSVESDESGNRCLVYYSKPNQKSKELPELSQLRERCPVAIYENYLLKRPLNARHSNSSLYLKPILECNYSTESIWFTNAPLGKNKIGSMINTALRRINNDNNASSGSLSSCNIFYKCESNRMNFLIAQAARRLSFKNSQLKKKAFGSISKRQAKFENQSETNENDNFKIEPLITDCSTLAVAKTNIVNTAQISQSASASCSNNTSLPFRKILPRSSCMSSSKPIISPTYSSTTYSLTNNFDMKTSIASKITSKRTRPSSKKNFQLPKTSHASSKVTTLLANTLKAKQDIGRRLSSSSESSQYSTLSSPPHKRKCSNEETPKHAYNTRSSSKRTETTENDSKYSHSDADSQENAVHLIDDDEHLPKIHRVKSISPVKPNAPQTIDVASLSQAILSSINNGVLKFVTNGNGTGSQSQVPITLKVVLQPNGTLIDQNGALRLENTTITCQPNAPAVPVQNDHIDLTSEESSGLQISKTSIPQTSENTFEVERNNCDELKELIELISLRDRISIPEYIHVSLVSDVLWQTGALSVKGPWFVIFSLWWMTHYYFGITDQEHQAKLQWGHFKLIKSRDDELTSASTCLTYVGPLNYITSTQKNICKFIYSNTVHNYINEGADLIDIYKHYRDKRPPDSFNDDSPFYLQSCVKGSKDVVANHDIWYENVPLNESKINALMRNMVQKIVRPNMHVVKNLSKHFPNILIPRLILSNSNIGAAASVSTAGGTTAGTTTPVIQMSAPLAQSTALPGQALPIVNYVNQSLQNIIPSSLLSVQNQGGTTVQQLSSLTGVSSPNHRILPQNLIVVETPKPATTLPASILSNGVQFSNTTPTVAAQPVATTATNKSVSTPVLPQASPIPLHQFVTPQKSAPATNQYSNLNDVISQLVNQRLGQQNSQAKLTTNPPIQIVQKPGETPTQTMQSLMVAVQQHAAQNNKVVQLFQLPPGTKLINPGSQDNATSTTTTTTTTHSPMQNISNSNNLSTSSTRSQPQQNIVKPPSVGPAITKVVSLHNGVPSSESAKNKDVASSVSKYVADIEPPQPSPDQLKTFSQVIDESLQCQDPNFMEYVEKLWWYKLLGCDNPWSLNFTLWFINVMAFGIESRAEHLRLALGDFKFCSLPDGRKYIYYYHKTNHRSYYLVESSTEESKFKCPINLFNVHRKVRPPGTLKNSDRFYLQPRVVNSKLTPIWFTEIGWGKNKLGSLMQDAANLAKLPISWLRKSRLKNIYYRPCLPSRTSDASPIAFDNQSVMSGHDADTSSILPDNNSSSLNWTNAPLDESITSNCNMHEVVCISDDEEDVKPDLNLLTNELCDSSQEGYENSVSPTNSNSETDKSRKRKNYRPMRFSD